VGCFLIERKRQKDSFWLNIAFISGAAGCRCCLLASLLNTLIIVNIVEINQKPDFDNRKIGAET
jgi:hypothetical protein